jgi:hypothetical protein
MTSLAAEHPFHDVGRLALELVADLGVDVGRDRQASVPERGRDHLQRHAVFQHERGRGVAAGVEAPATDPGPFGEVVPPPQRVTRIDPGAVDEANT